MSTVIVRIVSLSTLKKHTQSMNGKSKRKIYTFSIIIEYINIYRSIIFFSRPIGSSISYTQPKSDADRIHIADDFIRTTSYRIPLLIDPVSQNNPFSEVYAPWPIRFYVLDSTKVLSYIAQPIEGSFPLELIQNALNQAIKSNQ